MKEARAYGWKNWQTVNLIEAAEKAGFELLVTTDKNIQYQQNLIGRKIALLVLGNSQWPIGQTYGGGHFACCRRGQTRKLHRSESAVQGLICLRQSIE